MPLSEAKIKDINVQYLLMCFISSYPSNIVCPENVVFCIYPSTLQTRVHHESKHYEP